MQMNQAAEHPFDILGRWSRLSDDELTALATPDNCSLLLEIAALLEGPDHARNIDTTGFRSVVRRMRHLYEDQSWRLGEVIISAEDLREQDRHIEANEILQRFIDGSPSPFYKQVARSHLE
jgi:hypothetical protein